MQRVPKICVYCKAEREARGLPPKILGYEMMNVPPVVKEPTSDGICAECEAKYFPGIRPLRKEIEAGRPLALSRLEADVHDAVEKVDSYTRQLVDQASDALQRELGGIRRAGEDTFDALFRMGVEMSRAPQRFADDLVAEYRRLLDRVFKAGRL